MLNITSLSKRVSDNFILSLKSLEIKNGEIVALIGNNGSGKTLLLNSILNNILLDSGIIEIDNADNKLEKWKMITGVYMNTNYLLDFMTSTEFLSFIGGFYNISKKEVVNRLEFYQYFIGIEYNSIKKKIISKLSRGTKDKIGIIAALLCNPQLLILDEPFAHLDTPSSLKLIELLKLINFQCNTTQIITSPNLNNLSAFTTRIILMEKGSIIFDLPNEIGNQYIINDYYSI